METSNADHVSALSGKLGNNTYSGLWAEIAFKVELAPVFDSTTPVFQLVARDFSQTPPALIANTTARTGVNRQIVNEASSLPFNLALFTLIEDAMTFQLLAAREPAAMRSNISVLRLGNGCITDLPRFTTLSLSDLRWRSFESLIKVEITPKLNCSPTIWIKSWVSEVIMAVAAEKDGVAVKLVVFLHV